MAKHLGSSLLLLLAACSGDSSKAEKAPPPTQPAPAAAPKADGPSLVLITMDTTRADRIGAYGHAQAETPNVDKLASEGVRFERAYAVVPLTTPAHASMLTGLYPTRHGIHNNGDAILPENASTLAEQLGARGYKSAAAVSAFVTTRIWNLDQGFDAYFDDFESTGKGRGERWGKERPAEEVVDDLVKWLGEQNKDQPFFIWAHFYDPHDPYAPPAEWAKKHEGRPYDGEIAYMDHQIGRLRQAVEAAAGEKGAAWVVVADHGEAINGEHGEHAHGTFVFDPTMRIPFIVRPAKPLAQPTTVTDLTVSNVDVMPTALGLLGLEMPADLDGQNLAPLASGEKVERAPVYMESESSWSRFGFHPEWAAAEGPFKLFATPNPRLFNVAEDPAEEKNLLAEQPEIANKLDAFVDGIQARRVDVEQLAAGPEMIEQLAALGYVTGSGGMPKDLSGLPDAKDQQQVVAAVGKASRLARNPKRVNEAEALYRDILEKHPLMGEMRLSLARVLGLQRKHAEAEKILREGVELQPQSTILRSQLANTLARQGRLQEAYDLVRTVYEQVPGDDLARYSMLRFLSDMNRVEEAVAMGQQWLASDSNNRGLQALVGVGLVRLTRLQEAEPLLRASLEDDVPREQVHRSLGLIELARGNKEGLISHLQAEAEAFPFNFAVRIELGNALMSERRWDEAAAEYGALVELRPRDASLRRSHAQAVFNTGDYTRSAAILKPALSQAPDDPQVLLLHANILDKLGQTEEAKKVAEEAKALFQAGKAAEAAAAPIPTMYSTPEDGADDDLDIEGI